jgi:DNA-binding MarR family transcriptional regulator
MSAEVHAASAPLVRTQDPALDEVVAATAAFADAFVRWSGRKAVEAGANITRLRLLYSVHCHGPQKMADLADTLDVTPRNVTALVDGLESEGLVRRVPHSTDRRITLVELTCESGRIEAQFAAYQASLAALFAGLDEADRGALVRLMTRLHDRIHSDATCVAARAEAGDA